MSFSFFSFSTYLYGQENPLVINQKVTITLDMFKKRKIVEGEKMYNQLDSLFRAQNDLKSWLKINKKIAFVFLKMNQPFRGINRFKKALDGLWRKPDNIEEWKSLAWIYANIGFVYKSSIGDFKKALYYYQKCSDIFKDELKTDSLKYSKYYYPTIGNIYTRLGDYSKALYYLQKYKILAEKAKENDEFARAANDIAIVYQSTGKNDKALKILTKALKGVHLSYETKVMLYNNLAKCYLNINDLSKAFYWINNALLISKRIESHIEPELQTSVLNTLANIYFEQENFKESKKVILKAINILKEYYQNPARREVAKLYLQLAKFNLSLQNYYESLENCQYALKLVLNNFEDPNTEVNPSPNSFYYENTIAEALLGKAKAFEKLYTVSNNQKYLFLSIKTYKLVFKVWQILRSTYEYQKSELFVLSENRILLEKAISLSYEAWEKTGDTIYYLSAYSYCEQNKNMLLLEGINKRKAHYELRLPDSLVQKEHNLNMQISWYTKQLYKHKTNSEEIYQGIGKKLFNLKEQKKLLEKEFEKKFPKYYSLIYDLKIMSISEIQNKLKPEQMLIEYFVGEKNVFVFKICKNKIDIIRIPNNFSLATELENVRNGLFEYWKMPIEKQSDILYDSLNNIYVNSAHNLYNQIIKPLGILSPKLIIIPDGILGYLPFETLLTELPENQRRFKTHKYFCKKHVICYNYSSSLWKEMSKKKYKKDKLLAMAPKFGFNRLNRKYVNNKNNFNSLNWNLEEVKGITEIVSGKYLLGQKANKKNFENHARNYTILHLATHAMLDDKNSEFSFLAFSGANDDSDSAKIYVNDLYNMDLPLNMVVLSACETGIGKLEKGEGIISLARGFAYAGTKSIINSLWEVNDKSASEIMIDFYKNLNAGYTKDEALHNAKIDYIDGQIEDRTVHPFFWASFIATGDMTPVHFNNYYNLYLILFIILCIGGILIYLKRNLFTNFFDIK